MPTIEDSFFSVRASQLVGRFLFAGGPYHGKYTEVPEPARKWGGVQPPRCRKPYTRVEVAPPKGSNLIFYVYGPGWKYHLSRNENILITNEEI